MIEIQRENPFPINHLNKENRAIYEEWKRLFEICNNPPPDLSIGTVIMPTGDLMDRAGPSLEVFKQLAQTQEVPPYLVISGKYSASNLSDGGASAEKVVRAMRIYGDIPNHLKDKLIAENNAGNTKEQAENVYALMKDGKIQEPWVIVVSQYHLPRLVSTFVKQVLKKEPLLKTRIYAIPVDLPWEENVPHERRGKNGPTRWENVFSEMKRIEAYREKGDVATEEEAKAYKEWLTK